ncbi:MAG: hypothetical protein QXO17_07220 [Nitrososphaerota archaeon]|nr:hypothetical protein [Candidatus Calditenuis fumarioli]
MAGPLPKLMVLVLIVWASLLAVLASVGLIISATGQEMNAIAGLLRVAAALALFAVWALWMMMLVQFWYIKVLRR